MPRILAISGAFWWLDISDLSFDELTDRVVARSAELDERRSAKGRPTKKESPEHARRPRDYGCFWPNERIKWSFRRAHQIHGSHIPPGPRTYECLVSRHPELAPIQPINALSRARGLTITELRDELRY
jgi:hypothetical protein